VNTSHPKNLAVSSIRLAALFTAVGASRAFIRQTLTAWHLAGAVDVAELVVSELVTNAVKSTGITARAPMLGDITDHHLIGLQLRLQDDSLFVEVWDRGDGAPVIPEQSLTAEGGRGLFLVESLTTRWDIFHPEVGGKIVWAELPLIDTAQPSAEANRLPQCVQGKRGPVADGVLEVIDLALMQRVLDGWQLWPAVSRRASAG
jgi:anti-sigma regulatory factor (Ser/Thr protein kinase)